MIYDYADTFNRIAYAIAIGLTFSIPIGSIATGADPEYRRTASLSNKIGLLIMIFAFPIFYIYLDNYYRHMDSYAGRTVIAWSSLIIGLAIAVILAKTISYIIKLFGRE